MFSGLVRNIKVKNGGEREFSVGLELTAELEEIVQLIIVTVLL